jgi:hypothetical protein
MHQDWTLNQVISLHGDALEIATAPVPGLERAA